METETGTVTINDGDDKRDKGGGELLNSKGFEKQRSNQGLRHRHDL
jgi:hypothetical protein